MQPDRAAARPQQYLVQHMRELPIGTWPRWSRRCRASTATTTVKLAIESLVLTAARSLREGARGRVDRDRHRRTRVEPSRRRGRRRSASSAPLTQYAKAVLDAARKLSNGNALVFSSPRSKRFNDIALSGLLRTLEVPAVPHGFRSTFPD